MPDVTIDVSGEEGAFDIENPMGFDLRVVGFGLYIDMTHEQAEGLFNALSKFFVVADENAREGG